MITCLLHMLCHPQEYEPQFKTGIFPVSTTDIEKNITYVKPQNLIMNLADGRLLDAPFRGSIHLRHSLYKVRGLAVETGRNDVTAQGISLNPSRLGCLIYNTLTKVIPYC